MIQCYVCGNRILPSEGSLANECADEVTRYRHTQPCQPNRDYAASVLWAMSQVFEEMALYVDTDHSLRDILSEADWHLKMADKKIRILP